MERFFERILWNSRWVMIVPVIASIILAFAMFVVTTIDVVAVMGKVVEYIGASTDSRTKLQVQILSNIVALVDGYLFSAILLVFAVGLYELFIGKIQEAEGSEIGSRLLLIKTLDDLKDRLANVILLILIVKFFQQALNTKYESVLDLLQLSIAIVLIAGALFLSGRAKPAKSDPK